MPLYAFRCTACCYEFDRLMSLRDDQGAVRCPCCGEAVKRLVSTFATAGGSRVGEPVMPAPA